MAGLIVGKEYIVSDADPPSFKMVGRVVNIVEFGDAGGAVIELSNTLHFKLYVDEKVLITKFLIVVPRYPIDTVYEVCKWPLTVNIHIPQNNPFSITNNIDDMNLFFAAIGHVQPISDMNT